MVELEIVDRGATLEVDLELEPSENRWRLFSALTIWLIRSPTTVAISTALVVLLAVLQPPRAGDDGRADRQFGGTSALVGSEIIDRGPTLEVDLELETSENRWRLFSALTTWSTSSLATKVISTAVVALVAVLQPPDDDGVLLDTERPPHGSSSWGGAWASATGRGGAAGSRPRFRSISSAVRRLVTTAVTVRLPPQSQSQTSTPQVLAWRAAQSNVGLFFFAFPSGAPVARAAGGCVGTVGLGITAARAAAWDESKPCDAERSIMRSAAAGGSDFGVLARG